jgi:hypothetical protein
VAYLALFVAVSVILVATASKPGAVKRPPTMQPSLTPPPPSPAAPPPSSSATAPDEPSVQQLAGQVSDARAFKHLQALQKIADGHGDNRAAGTPGYDASVEDVVDVLRDAGFKPSTRPLMRPERTATATAGSSARSSRRPAPETPGKS